jgi:hypothetical protein
MSEEVQDRRESDQHIARLETQLREHIEIDNRERREIRVSIKHLSDSIADLLQAWNTANGVGTFLKWLSGMAVALAFIWAMARDYFGGRG